MTNLETVTIQVTTPEGIQSLLESLGLQPDGEAPAKLQLTIQGRRIDMDGQPAKEEYELKTAVVTAEEEIHAEKDGDQFVFNLNSLIITGVKLKKELTLTAKAQEGAPILSISAEGLKSEDSLEENVYDGNSLYFLEDQDGNVTEVSIEGRIYLSNDLSRGSVKEIRIQGRIQLDKKALQFDPAPDRDQSENAKAYRAELPSGFSVSVSGGNREDQADSVRITSETQKPIQVTVVNTAADGEQEAAIVSYTPEAVEYKGQTEPDPIPDPAPGISMPVFLGGLGGAAVAAAVISAVVTNLAVKAKKKKKSAKSGASHGKASEHQAAAAASANGSNRQLKLKIGRLHNVGRRRNQQDNLGVQLLDNGVLAVVADGMGGLSNGEKVSGLIVQNLLNDITLVAPNQRQNCLYSLLARVNVAVNNMLGPSGIYKSGSTLLTVLVEQIAGQWSFQWVTVGDSRIYLYRNGAMLQINREHTYLKDLILEAVRGEISFQEAASNSKRASLTSFIGMGELKYIDGSTRSISLRENDVILLMSDGVFNAVSDEGMAEILSNYPDMEEAARKLEEQVLAAQNPNQDNFTALMLRLAADD